MNKLLTIAVPDGKRAEWINDVLTLVDEENVDKRPITERVKTFEDACNELGDEHPLVDEYIAVQDALLSSSLSFSDDLIAYLKLRIIVAALNEGWEPKFTEDEYRYYPWFSLYTKEQYDALDNDRKGRVVYRVCYANAYGGVSSAYVGSRLVFRTEELAVYAGRQFIKEWADFVLKPRTVDDVKQL